LRERPTQPGDQRVAGIVEGRQRRLTRGTRAGMADHGVVFEPPKIEMPKEEKNE